MFVCISVSLVSLFCFGTKTALAWEWRRTIALFHYWYQRKATSYFWWKLDNRPACVIFAPVFPSVEYCRAQADFCQIEMLIFIHALILFCYDCNSLLSCLSRTSVFLLEKSCKLTLLTPGLFYATSHCCFLFYCMHVYASTCTVHLFNITCIMCVFCGSMHFCINVWIQPAKGLQMEINLWL